MNTTVESSVMTKTHAAAFASVLALLISIPCAATVFLPFDLTSQVRDSDVVFEGTVEIVFACPDPTDDVPRTCASVAVDRYFKGDRGEHHLTLVVPGGEAANGTYVQVVGAPTFHQGETVLVSTFQTPDPTGLSGLVNFDTALLRKHQTKEGDSVTRNAEGRTLSKLPLDGRAVFHQPAGASEAAAVDPQPLSWDAARRAVARAVARSR